jgi:hypothetical protein
MIAASIGRPTASKRQHHVGTRPTLAMAHHDRAAIRTATPPMPNAARRPANPRPSSVIVASAGCPNTRMTRIPVQRPRRPGPIAIGVGRPTPSKRQDRAGTRPTPRWIQHNRGQRWTPNPAQTATSRGYASNAQVDPARSRPALDAQPRPNGNITRVRVQRPGGPSTNAASIGRPTASGCQKHSGKRPMVGARHDRAEHWMPNHHRAVTRPAPLSVHRERGQRWTRSRVQKPTSRGCASSTSVGPPPSRPALDAQSRPKANISRIRASSPSVGPPQSRPAFDAQPRTSRGYRVQRSQRPTTGVGRPSMQAPNSRSA